MTVIAPFVKRYKLALCEIGASWGLMQDNIVASHIFLVKNMSIVEPVEKLEFFWT